MTHRPTDRPVSAHESLLHNEELRWQAIGPWKEQAPSTLRTETVVLPSRAAPLDVCGDAKEAALLVNGTIHAYHWSHFCGTVAQYLIRLASPGSVTAENAFMHSVETPVAQEESLAAHFSGLLALLGGGRYSLVLEDIQADAYVVDLEQVPANGVVSTDFYAGFGAMIATQPLSILSSARVEQLAAQIRDGARPVVLTLAAGENACEFIIDGHHKLAAYRRERVPVRRLNIVKHDSAHLPLRDVLAFVPNIDDFETTVRANRGATGPD